MVIEPDLELPGSSRLLILSDLHIADRSPADLFGDHDDALAELLARESGEVDAVVLNGDVLDHLHVHDNERIERAHPRALEALRELPRRAPVIMVLGNHDDEALARAAFPDYAFHHAIAVGDDVCITHGHQFDLHWGGERPSRLAARFHVALEHHLRAPIRLPFRDFDNLPNRVVHRLFFRWTQALRLYGWLRRATGDVSAYRRWQRVDRFWSRGQWGDLGNIYDEAMFFLETVGGHWKTLVVGHSHQPGVMRRGGHTYVNSGSWCLGDASYVRLRDGDARIFDAVSGVEYGDERYRALDVAVELPDMAGWFRRYYRGFFRYDLAALERDFPSDIPERGFSGVRDKRRLGADSGEQHGQEHQLAG